MIWTRIWCKYPADMLRKEVGVCEHIHYAYYPREASHCLCSPLQRSRVGLLKEKQNPQDALREDN